MPTSQRDEPESPLKDAPDFGAAFVELPGLDVQAEIPEPGDPVEVDLVQGPDLGMARPEAPSPTEAVPDPKPAREVAPAGRGRTGGVPPASGRRKPPPRRRPPPKKKLTRRRMVGGVVALGLVIIAGGTAAGFLNVPGFMWLQDWFGEVPYPDLTLDGPQPIEPVLRYSLELATYREDEFALALEMRNTLRSRLPDLLFSLTPVERDGVVSYILHAGPAVDVVDAENLRGPLGDVLTREDPDEWPIRTTTRGFYLGERETLEEARDYLESVESEGAVGYIIYVSYPDGSEAFEILSGAFEGVDSARWWQLALHDEYGFRDVPFIERRGRAPE